MLFVTAVKARSSDFYFFIADPTIGESTCGHEGTAPREDASDSTQLISNCVQPTVESSVREHGLIPDRASQPLQATSSY